MPGIYDVPSQANWPTARAQGHFNALAHRIDVFAGAGRDPYGNNFAWELVIHGYHVDFLGGAGTFFLLRG